MNRRLVKYLILFAFVAIALAALCVVSGLASATDYDWDGGDAANQLASDPDNWNPDGVPVTGDVITVSGGNDKAITWDLGAGVVIASYDQGNGYSGTVTTTSIFNCSGVFGLHGGTFVQGAFAVNTEAVMMDGGTLTGTSGAAWTCSGNWIRIAGTITSDVLQLVLTGTGKTLEFSGNPLSMTISGSYAMNNAGEIYMIWGGTIVISGSLNLNNVNAHISFLINPYGGAYSQGNNINGNLYGIGYFEIFSTYTSSNLFGTYTGVNCPVKIDLRNVGAGDKVVTVISALTFGNTLTVYSFHTTDTMTLDLAGHSLSATSITVSTGGIISSSVAGAELTATGSISVLANGQIDATNIAFINCKSFDPSAGIWVPDNCQVNMTTAYGTLKLGGTQTLYDLQMVNNTNVTGTSSVTHLIKYSGMGVSELYHWLNATVTIGNYPSNASGLIDIPARVLGIGNLYRMEWYAPSVLYPPIITTLPTLSVNIGYSYTYSALANQSVVWVITSNASWASISNNSISGIVNILDVGEYYVHIVGRNANGTVYQNYTVTIMAPITTLSDTSIIWLVLLLTFTAIGIIRVRLFGIFTGIIWIVAALIFFYPSYGYILMLFPLGFGMLWMVISLNELMSTEVKA